jgi:hypothetical protein
MVETALILPLLLLLVLGAVELSRAAAASSTVLHASAEAARYGQVNGDLDAPGIRQAFVNVAAQGSVPVRPENVALAYYDSADSQLIGADAGSGYSAASPCPLATPQSCARPVPGDYLTVTGTVPWSAAEPLIGAILGQGFQLVRSTTVRIED